MESKTDDQKPDAKYKSKREKRKSIILKTDKSKTKTLKDSNAKEKRSEV